jgi:hypothetical protein
MKLIYSRRSLRHLQAIRDYVAQDNPEAADRTVQRIRTAIDRSIDWLAFLIPVVPRRTTRGFWPCQICSTLSSIVSMAT